MRFNQSPAGGKTNPERQLRLSEAFISNGKSLNSGFFLKEYLNMHNIFKKKVTFLVTFFRWNPLQSKKTW
ncbi:hypothetical protein A9168_12485 [Macellibacteroides sp. HH-ZS]|nr:hypothetical protein A9168_12485 [Macellibacteroides sp. HH-ZS]